MEQKVLQGLIGEDIKLDNFENKETVLLNSPGGDLYTGFSMYDFNKASSIDIGIVGVCGSAATIALLGSKTRWGTPNSRYLIHNPSLSLEGFASEFEEAAVMLRAETERILDIYETHLNGSRDDIRAWMNEEKLWDAKTALERNLITNIKDIDFASRVPEGSNINNLFTNFKMSIKMKEEDKQNLSGIETKLDKILNNFKSFFAPKKHNGARC